MAKKRRNRSADEDDGAEARTSDDPLGKLRQKHHVSLAGVLVVAGVIALVGLGFVTYALFETPVSLLFLLVGTAVLLFAVVALGMNVFNVGRRLELRKRGV